MKHEDRTMLSRRMNAGCWMRENLTAQGYRLCENERRELAVGLRFTTGLCLSLVVVALALQSPVMVFALAGIGVFASFAARHPFDYLWNHGIRRFVDAPVLPPNPARRRHAFKVATVWLVVVGALLAAGFATIALVFGGLLVAACAVVTATNLCLPSETLAWIERRRTHSAPLAT
jgi:hypothetical protein